jgi:hypothetical protein
MSLATLKRKTAAKYNNMSVGHANFSLNGTHRSQGYVGQTLVSDTGLLCTNDPNVVKSSVGTSSSHVQAQHFQSTRNGVSMVKPDSNHIVKTQNVYIEKSRKLAIAACANTEKNAPSKTLIPCSRSTNIAGTGGLPIFGTKAVTASTVVSCTTTKDMSGESKSSGARIFNMSNDCADIDKKTFNPIKNMPLPGTF